MKMHASHLEDLADLQLINAQCNVGVRPSVSFFRPTLAESVNVLLILSKICALSCVVKIKCGEIHF